MVDQLIAVSQVLIKGPRDQEISDVADISNEPHIGKTSDAPHAAIGLISVDCLVRIKETSQHPVPRHNIWLCL